MADIATIAAALGSIKTASDIARLIKDSGSSLEQAEVKLKIAELIGALADAKIEIAGVQSDLIEKDKIIAELHSQLDLKQKVVWEKPYYWTADEGEKDGPFCQHCYDVSQRLVRLQSGRKGAWFCNSCKNSYYDKDYVPSQPRRSRGYTL